MKIKKVSKYVLNVLERNELARKDNFILIGGVLKDLNIDIRLPLAEIFKNHSQYNVPDFESILRARRKIIEKRPDLNDNNVKKLRAKKTEEIVEYALEK